MRIAIFNMLYILIPSIVFSQSIFEKFKVCDYNNSIELLTTATDTIVIEYTIGEFYKNLVFINDSQYYNVYLSGEGLIKEKGNPELAKIVRSITIPGEAKMKSEVIYSEYKEIPIQIAPSKGILSREIDPNKVPFEFSDIYTQDAFYPANIVQLGDPYLIRKTRGITVTVHPFFYNPVRHILRIYTKLQIKVVLDGIDLNNSISVEIPEYNTHFEPILKRRFLNYKIPSPRLKSVGESGKMLIITADAYVEEINPLKEYNNNNGLTTDIEVMSDIGSTASDVEDYIQDYYDTCNTLSFVLLVGDDDDVPTKFITYYPSPYHPETGESDPSYSLVSGSDYYPDIIIGRFSAENESQVTKMVNRTIFYKSSIYNDNWAHDGAGIASAGGPGDNNEYDYQHLRNIRDSLLNYHYYNVDEFYDGSQGGQDAPGNPTVTMVSSSVNGGISIINYTGHGQEDRWTTSNFTNTDVTNLTNADMLPFIFSVACEVGSFSNYTCFAESWIRAEYSNKPAGAIGFYGSSIEQDWSPPMEAQDEFNELLTEEENLTFGALCFNGSCQMMDIYGNNPSASGTNMFLTWHLFGDPSIKVIPHNINNCPANLSITNDISGGYYSYRASNTITATNKIKDNAIVHYGATSSITLSTNFEVELGSTLEINNNGCN